MRLERGHLLKSQSMKALNNACDGFNSRHVSNDFQLDDFDLPGAELVLWVTRLFLENKVSPGDGLGLS